MKKYFFILPIIIFCQSCIKPDKESESLYDFQVKMYENYRFNNDTFRMFVEDYINLPENKERKVFTLYIDQRMDTLLFTIWRNPSNTVELENSFGYFYYKEKAIIIYSPFFKLFEMHRDTVAGLAISKLYNEELEYYKTHKQELVMWQLQIPYHGNAFSIQKNFSKIYNTTKPPIPDSVKVNIKYQAD